MGAGVILAYPLENLIGEFGILELATRCGNAEILDIPIFRQILMQKWNSYSKYFFYKLMGVTILQSILLTVGFLTADFIVPFISE
mmetsp:Transcript_6346/g.15329  ORF Transcript_6346/g.15329 Transcript_6346/m.15329 type:complete len:85 (+) Transcript_6346:176-430(+)